MVVMISVTPEPPAGLRRPATCSPRRARPVGSAHASARVPSPAPGSRPRTPCTAQRSSSRQRGFLSGADDRSRTGTVWEPPPAPPESAPPPPAAAAVCGRAPRDGVHSAVVLFDAQCRTEDVLFLEQQEQLLRQVQAVRAVREQMHNLDAALQRSRLRAEQADGECLSQQQWMARRGQEANLRGAVLRTEQLCQRMQAKLDSARQARVHPAEVQRRRLWARHLAKTNMRLMMRAVLEMFYALVANKRRERNMKVQAGAIARTTNVALRRRYLGLWRRYAAAGRLKRRRHMQGELLFRSTAWGLTSDTFRKLLLYRLHRSRRRQMLRFADALLGSTGKGQLLVFWRRFTDCLQASAERRKRQEVASTFLRNNKMVLLRHVWRVLMTFVRLRRRDNACQSQAGLLWATTVHGLRLRYFMRWRGIATNVAVRVARHRCAMDFLRRHGHCLLAMMYNRWRHMLYGRKRRLLQEARANAIMRLQGGDVLRTLFSQLHVYALRRRAARLAYITGKGAVLRQRFCDDEEEVRIRWHEAEVARRELLLRRLQRYTRPLGRTGSVGFIVSQIGSGPVIVRHVSPGGPAVQAGIRIGDTILSVRTPLGLYKVTSADRFQDICGPSGFVFEGTTIELTVVRGSEHLIQELRQAAKQKKPARQNQRARLAADSEPVVLTLTLASMGAGAKQSRMRQLEKIKLRDFGDRFDPNKVFNLAHCPESCKKELATAFSEVSSGDVIRGSDFGRFVWAYAQLLGVSLPPIERWAGASDELRDSEDPSTALFTFDQAWRFLRDLFYEFVHGPLQLPPDAETGEVLTPPDSPLGPRLLSTEQAT
eukprot:TRINITY_DN19246_c0_g1_i1.p1 TRINITY_DN19246_c0_g1~~TRINITY_DN19246_c0_g1_i1.p1  ORF type:complete len:824 (+),score=261.23 TRINITY_DN19246_c0_g1_i1:79-2550(+)